MLIREVGIVFLADRDEAICFIVSAVIALGIFDMILVHIRRRDISFSIAASKIQPEYERCFVVRVLHQVRAVLVVEPLRYCKRPYRSGIHMVIELELRTVLRRSLARIEIAYAFASACDGLPRQRIAVRFHGIIDTRIDCALSDVVIHSVTRKSDLGRLARFDEEYVLVLRPCGSGIRRLVLDSRR